jgi:hypothetical protein
MKPKSLTLVKVTPTAAQADSEDTDADGDSHCSKIVPFQQSGNRGAHGIW